MKSTALHEVRHQKEPTMKHDEKEEVLRPMDAKDSVATMKKNSVVIVLVYVVLILLGVGTGYILSTKRTSGSGVTSKNGSIATTAKVVGVQDASKYTNCPTGKLEAGGIDGEGTHHLIRPGGPSQTAYLMSSLIDLDQYVNLTVKICGATKQAKKAPWLMDVERLELQ